MHPSSMARQVFLLAVSQALFQTVSVLVMTVGALAGGVVAPDPGLATVPIAAMFLGTALTTFPAAAFMARVGRRAGFLIGSACGLAGGVIGALAMLSGGFAPLCLGTFLIGCNQGFAQFYRFAASEVADDAFRPRAISLVLAGGIVAALAGPEIARWGGPLLAAPFAGSFLLQAVVSALAFVTLLFVHVPMPPASTHGGRALSAIIRQPDYAVALLGAATGYGAMILAMTATPLAMRAHDHGLDHTALVFQAHVLAMFLPSFFTGTLITRFGAPAVMLAGVAVLVVHVALTLTGVDLLAFVSSLVCLGIGWNFLFVGGTSLLTTTYAPEERARAQAFNDMMLFAVSLLCSVAAGALLRHLGWIGLNLALLPFLALAALAILWRLPHRPVPAPA